MIITIPRAPDDSRPPRTPDEALRAYVADRPLLWGLGFDPPDADPEVVALVSEDG